MDKLWMSKNRLSKEYEVGVDAFLKFAVERGCDDNLMSCPCAKCANTRKHKLSLVKGHIIMNGMDMTYRKWIWHGEGLTSSQSTYDTNCVGKCDTSCNVEEPIAMIHDAYDAYEDNPTHFQTLLEDAEKPLYKDCSHFTKLSATIKIYNLKAKYGWSDTSFKDLLKLIKEMLPEGNLMPASLYAAKKTLSTLGLDYKKIHACPNDCILYRKEFKDSNDCPTCGMSRWKTNTKSMSVSKVSSKVLWYFPPIPRFRRMFRTPEISKELTWHLDERTRDGTLRHPADAPAWKLVDSKWPDFGQEPRNLRLALAADGMNPHSMMSSNYSCWPVILVTYNLPPWLCMKRKFMMLTLLISGPKQPGNDIDVYLAPLIDDLKELWEVGIQAYDGYRDESFTLIYVLLWTINDFPAYGNLSGYSVKGYKACPICADKTHSFWLPKSRKMSYTGHRQWLPLSHPYRRQKKAFDGKQLLDTTAPKPLSGSEVLERMQTCNCVWGKTKGKNLSDEGSSKKRKRKGTKSTNLSATSSDESSCFKKKSIFYELEYWKHLHIRHILDVMHIEKNVLESLLGTLLDIPGKTKDGYTERLDLEDMNMRLELAPHDVGKKTCLPPACYTLSKEEKKNVCTSFLGMKVPDGYSSNISSLVSMKDLKLIGLKSHDCHVLMQQLLPIAIRGVLPKHVRIAITRMCLFFNEICNKEIEVSRLEEVQKEVVITLCLLEKYFLPSFFDIMVHLTVHLVREVKLCGPVWYRWMYPFERYMKILKGYVRNRTRPEGCIVESYIVEEAVEFCSEYLFDVNTIGIPSSHHKLDVTEASSGCANKIISDEEREQAHRYVLTNDPDIDPYIEEHKAHLAVEFPKKNPKWLQDEHNKSFLSWMRDHVAADSKYQLSDRLKTLCGWPTKRVLTYASYTIDGVIFSTINRDANRVTQNSGVSMRATVMQISSAKDKKPIVSDMVFYGRIEEIWELDYTKFQVVVFKCSWIDNNSGVKVDDSGFTLVKLNKLGYQSDPFILGSQAKQVFYIQDPEDVAWSVVLATPNKRYTGRINRDDLGDTSMQLQSFSSGVPIGDTSNASDENEPPCVRKDCDAIWINNANL